jgi:hypothetical protein
VGIAGSWNRAAYAAQKKAAVRALGTHVEGLGTGKRGKVVPIRSKR